jgi:anti-sigma regulatory factor (Ser/Thr protein kinase)
MTPHRLFSITEASQVGEARRVAAVLAAEQGFDETAAGRLALVINELGNNLVRHAQKGRLLVGRGGAADDGIDVVSIDDGPGMTDVQACLRDGYSTGSTPGTGLGAVKRLADRFSIFSQPGRGTLISARMRAGPAAHDAPPSRFLVGAIALPAPGETVCGDAWALREGDGTMSVILADGLGHGPHAAEAADKACDVFLTVPGTPAQVLERAHLSLKATRGAAVSIAALDGGTDAVKFAGAGNVSGRVMSGVGEKNLMSQHGTVGLSMRKLVDVDQSWPDHALLVLHSDGIATRWSLGDAVGLLQCDPVLIAAWLIRDHCRGRDDATAVVIRRREP